MKGIEVGLSEMLLCRERRANLQTELISAYRCPLISFSMNIPGPIKTNGPIRAAFEAGKQELLKTLEEHHIKVLKSVQFNETTGDELMFAVAPEAKIPPDTMAEFSKTVKELTSRIEDTHPLGRLFDLDVITPEGTKLSRPVFRKCLICGKQAQECARSRAHTVEEMQARIDELLAGAET